MSDAAQIALFARSDRKGLLATLGQFRVGKLTLSDDVERALLERLWPRLYADRPAPQHPAIATEQATQAEVMRTRRSSGLGLGHPRDLIRNLDRTQDHFGLSGHKLANGQLAPGRRICTGTEPPGPEAPPGAALVTFAAIHAARLTHFRSRTA